jgi:hypothetical protein
MSYKYKNICTAQLKFSLKKTQENTVVTHEAIQKYIHIYIPILSTYAIYMTFKWMCYFLENKYSSAEYNECMIKYRFSAILNCALSFIKLLRSDGRLLKIFIPA